MLINLWKKITKNQSTQSKAECCKIEIKEVPQTDVCCSQNQSK